MYDVQFLANSVHQKYQYQFIFRRAIKKI